MHTHILHSKTMVTVYTVKTGLKIKCSYILLHMKLLHNKPVNVFGESLVMCECI